MKERDDILQTLYQVILERKAAPSENSYTASLMEKGIDKILKKVGEEAAELIIAAKGGSHNETVYEAADLIFHTLILLGHRDIPLDAVLDELRRRFGTSGITEKLSRKN